jgi:mannose-6-phosphate isomerase-like protein (cupin superfamily)
MTTFEQFDREMRAQGFDEIAERSWPPGTVTGEHRHPFSVKALVVAGEMWLDCPDRSLHLRAGDSFELDREQPHAERYGDAGATYWAARKNAG